jgi:hypothetical protein
VDFLFRKAKEELAGLHLSQESLRNAWEGVVCTIAEEEFSKAFIGGLGDLKSVYGSVVTKKLKNKQFSNYNGCLFIELFKFDFDSTLNEWSKVTYIHFFLSLANSGR